jgi:hypothetical protein
MLYAGAIRDHQAGYFRQPNDPELSGIPLHQSFTSAYSALVSGGIYLERASPRIFTSARFSHRTQSQPGLRVRPHSLDHFGVPRLGLPVGGPSSETSARGDGLTKRSLGCACRAFQSHHSSTPTGCRCRILIREHIAVDRDETLLIRIVPRGKAAADNM